MITVPTPYRQDLEYKAEAVVIELLKTDATLAKLLPLHHDEDEPEDLRDGIRLKVKALEQGEAYANTGVYRVEVEVEMSGNSQQPGQQAGDLAVVFGKLKRLLDIRSPEMEAKLNALVAGIEVGQVQRHTGNTRANEGLVRNRSITRTLVCNETA